MVYSKTLNSDLPLKQDSFSGKYPIADFLFYLMLEALIAQSRSGHNFVSSLQGNSQTSSQKFSICESQKFSHSICWANFYPSEIIFQFLPITKLSNQFVSAQNQVRQPKQSLRGKSAEGVYHLGEFFFIPQTFLRLIHKQTEFG